MDCVVESLRGVYLRAGFACLVTPVGGGYHNYRISIFFYVFLNVG